jgi:hypothetical protein
MAWKARLFLGLMLTVMLIAIAGPAMADNNRQERREDRLEWREELREDNLFINHHDGFHGCCNDFELDEVEIFDFGLVPWYYFAADNLEYCFWEYEGEGEWEYECEDLD